MANIGSLVGVLLEVVRLEKGKSGESLRFRTKNILLWFFFEKFKDIFESFWTLWNFFFGKFQFFQYFSKFPKLRENFWLFQNVRDVIYRIISKLWQFPDFWSKFWFEFLLVAFFRTPESNYYSKLDYTIIRKSRNDRQCRSDTYQLIKIANFNISKIRLIFFNF